VNFPIIENSYQFECTRCGNCCTGDQQVFLNPYDLYKMTRYRGYYHTKVLFEDNLVNLVQSQNGAWIPQIKFKSVSAKKHKFCPFLSNELTDDNRLLGLCNLHPDHKPLVCAMAPIGRTIDFSDNSETHVFVKPAPDCPGVKIKKENKLADLLGSKAQELHYEMRFLKILDEMTAKNKNQQDDFLQLYYFNTERPFIGIIEHLENIHFE